MGEIKSSSGWAFFDAASLVIWDLGQLAKVLLDKKQECVRSIKRKWRYVVNGIKL